jgi:hypothetical protein
MRFRGLVVAVVAGIGASIAPANAQRDAISSTLSPEAAAAAFDDAVIAVCIPTVSQGAIPTPVRGRLQQTTDAATRKQAGAAADETVWDVMAGKGVVTVHEKPGRCTVSVYGPPAMATIMDLAKLLTNSNFERLAGAAAPPNGFGQTLTHTAGGKRLMVVLKGSDPGMPGHQSRFSVITATVFSAP